MRGHPERGVTIAQVRSEIAGRLRRVCQNFAEADFAALVDRMAEIEVRYRFRDDWLIYREAIARAATPSFHRSRVH